MTKTRIKMCGFTRSTDIENAVNAGADAIGLVFYPQSKRAVNTVQAVELVKAIPPFVSAVGLFVNAKAEAIHSALSQVRLSLLQFHGDESADFCESFKMPYIKAVRLPVAHSDTASRQLAQQYLSKIVAEHINATGFLLDAAVADRAGGTGQCFDWSVLNGAIDRPIILAGGLNPKNTTQAITTLKPYAVDVSSGIETAPGLKDKRLMSAFVKTVLAVNH